MLACAFAMIAVLGFGFLLGDGRPGASAQLCRENQDGRALSKLSKLTPLPGSTILSRPDLEFYSSAQPLNQFDVGVVTGESLFVQARIGLDSEQGVLAISLDSSDCMLTPDGTSDSAVLTLEHLYGIVLASGVDTRFRLEVCEPGGICAPQLPPDSSQYVALRKIFELRAAKLAQLREPEAYKRWSSFEIEKAGAMRHSVSATIRGPAGPSAGMEVAFSKAPHLGCFAVTDDAGIARCELEDYHGDDGHTHKEEAVRFTVTLTGGTKGKVGVLPVSLPSLDNALGGTAVSDVDIGPTNRDDSAVHGDLEQVDVRRPDRRLTPGWLLTVHGKGGRIRQVPVPGHLVDELGAELDRLLQPDDVLDERNREIHVLAVLDEDASELTSWSTSGMYQAIKRSWPVARQSWSQEMQLHCGEPACIGCGARMGRVRSMGGRGGHRWGCRLCETILDTRRFR